MKFKKVLTIFALLFASNFTVSESSNLENKTGFSDIISVIILNISKFKNNDIVVTYANKDNYIRRTILYEEDMFSLYE